MCRAESTSRVCFCRGTIKSSGTCALVVVVVVCRLSVAERKKEERKTSLMVCFFSIGIDFSPDECAVDWAVGLQSILSKTSLVALAL